MGEVGVRKKFTRCKESLSMFMYTDLTHARTYKRSLIPIVLAESSMRFYQVVNAFCLEAEAYLVWLICCCSNHQSPGS